LSALLMRAPRTGERRFVLFRWFTRGLDATRARYGRALGWQLRHLRWVGAAFVVGLLATGVVYRAVPTSFVPDEDQNYFITQVIGPPGASLDYMTGIAKQTEAALRSRPEVSHIFSVLGFNFTGNGSNRAVIFTSLTPISGRKGAAHSAPLIVADLRRRLLGIPGAIVIPFLPPPIQGQGSTGGFTFELLDRSGNPQFDTLAGAGMALQGEATRTGKVGGLFSTFSVDDPQLALTIDREKAKSIGVSVDQIGTALGVYLGSQYVNDFDLGARAYRVYAQAAAGFRDQPRDIGQLYVRSQSGALVALDGLVNVSSGVAPPVISHYNLYRSIELAGTPSAGVSSGEAIKTMETAAHKVLPPDIGFEWSGLSWEEVRAGNQALIIFVLGLTFVFLVLAAQYESLALPFIIILAVPLALLGALGAQRLRGLTNDVFCQIGLLMLIGLASKNAILIVEFAEQLRHKGASAVDAVKEATLLRLRPILMTSFAFLLGIMPLVFASGSGANGRHSMGTALFGGLLVSTVLNLFFTPALYLMMEGARERFSAWRARRRPDRPFEVT
ncbi:MAG TPA: efflux RND transporter permease subunit, partial [Polyangia bacterium]|nr:efflux RND transporter permease subunit [Polyangia bacterium]